MRCYIVCYWNILNKLCLFELAWLFMPAILTLDKRRLEDCINPFHCLEPGTQSSVVSLPSAGFSLSALHPLPLSSLGQVVRLGLQDRLSLRGERALKATDIFEPITHEAESWLTPLLTWKCHRNRGCIVGFPSQNMKEITENALRHAHNSVCTRCNLTSILPTQVRSEISR